MLLYHGSDMVVEKPQLLNRKKTLDFGVGFYTTSNRDEAEAFAGKVRERNESLTQFVSVYQFNPDTAIGDLNILRFISPDEKWLDFVCANRMGIYAGIPYDLIIGAVANDKVYKTLAQYERGERTRAEVLERLKINKLYDQYVFASNKALSLLKFEYSFVPITSGEGDL
ncbi:MAG: DUF3990 domain-containing protein [Clostridiaceae bacterium]|jgi:hypothetical protein|nr:DUF3990 domain-containing protein [Clostridiaceae bacterium]